MEVGSMGTKDAIFDRMFSGEGRFSREAGEIGDVAPDAAAALYAPRIEKLFADEGFGEFDVSVSGSEIDFMAFNSDGSNVRLGLEVNDALELEVLWATGISVQNGNEIDLNWWFEGREEKFADVADLKAFVDQFKDW